jgi:hypothetical protein
MPVVESDVEYGESGSILAARPTLGGGDERFARADNLTVSDARALALWLKSHGCSHVHVATSQEHIFCVQWMRQ